MLFPFQNPSNMSFNVVKGCHQLALRCSIGCKTPLIGSRLPRAFDPQPTFRDFNNQLPLNNQPFEQPPAPVFNTITFVQQQVRLSTCICRSHCKSL